MFKRFLAVIVVVFALFGFSATAFYYADEKTSIRILKKAEHSAVDSLTRLMLVEIQRASSDISFLSESPDVVSFFLNPTPQQRQRLGEWFRSFSRQKKIYDQVRLIAPDGMELLRVNYGNGVPQVVPESDLQSKRHRYYFENALVLQEGQGYMSPLDLNIEHKKVEVPYKPMIRFSKPVFAPDGRKLGVVVLNYFARNLLELVRLEDAGNQGDSYLLNGDGYFLYGPPEDKRWGFMFPDKQDETFGKTYPDEWQSIAVEPSGQMNTLNGLFTFTTFSPSPGHWDSDLKLTIVSLVPSAEVAPGNASLLSAFFFVYITVLGALGGAAWLIHRRMEEAGRNFTEFISPLNVIIIVGFSVFMAELLVMAILFLFPPLPPLLAAVVDATMLVALVSPVLYFLVLKPLVQQVKKERELMMERMRLSTAIEQTAECVVITDKQGTIQYVNPAFEKITGYHRDEVTGRNASVVKSGRHDKDFYKGLWERVLSGRAWEGHFINRKKDGTLYEEYAIISPIFDAKGEITNFVAVKRDVTFQAMLDRARQYFTSVTSHELNTPLTRLNLVEVMLANLRQSVDDAGKVDEILTPLRQAYGDLNRVASATKLLNDLSAADAEKKFYTVLVFYVLLSAVDDVRDGVKNENRRVRIALNDDDLPNDLRIKGKQELIERALIEILSNAVKYTPDGQAVTVDGFVRDGKITIRVTDPGAGMPLEKKHDAMEPFFSLENPMLHSTGLYKFKGGGIGLGLTIVKMIMEYHDGSMEITTPESGTGTIVSLTFPLDSA